MKSTRILILVVFALFVNTLWGGEGVTLKNSRSWQLSGRLQFQHVFNPDVEPDARVTRQGFRMRRGRFQVKAQLNDFIAARMQLSVRDARVRILDLDATFRLLGNGYLRVGQFKVPVWREELRSSGKLLLVERSPVAGFLLGYNLSGRQIGMEFGWKTVNGIRFMVNVSNGSGINVREDAGRSKSNFVNNGKLFTARITVPIGEALEFGLSGALNEVGYRTDGLVPVDTRDVIMAVAPDANLRLPGNLELEGGVVLGTVGKNFVGAVEDESFVLADVTGRWLRPFSTPVDNLAGLSALEVAGGFSYVGPNPSNQEFQKMRVFRFGPALYFGKRVRLQTNAEIQQPADDNQETTYLIRTQFTVNF